MLFGFGAWQKRPVYGIVLDIGSGSVGAAIMESCQGTKRPNLLWTGREAIVRKHKDPTATAVKCALEVAIQTMFDAAAKRGMQALRAHDPHASITQIQVSIAAPWSFTVTKTVRVKHEQPFILTKEVIAGMTEKARTEAHAEFERTKASSLQGLALLSNTAMHIYANGYAVHEPIGKKVTEASSEQLIDLADTDLVHAVEEGVGKSFSGAQLHIHSFMRIYYAALCDLQVNTRDACLVDVTDETTELGIVQNGMLVHVAHVPYGTSTVARLIAASYGIPIHEGLSHVRSDALIAAEKSAPKLQGVTEEYDQAVREALEQSGSMLAVPKTIFLHTDRSTEAFFTRRLSEIARRTSKIDPAIHTVTSRFLDAGAGDDSALLIGAHVLHTGPFVCTW